MRIIYALLAFSSFVVAFWYCMALYMVYQIGKDMGVWVNIGGLIK